MAVTNLSPCPLALKLLCAALLATHSCGLPHTNVACKKQRPEPFLTSAELSLLPRLTCSSREHRRGQERDRPPPPQTKMRAAPRDKWYIMVLSCVIMLLITLFAAGLIFVIYCFCNAALRLASQVANPAPPRPFPAVENQVAHQACDLFAQWGQAAHVDPGDTSLYDILGIHWPCGGDGNDYAALAGQVRDAYMDTADSFTPNVLVRNAGTLNPERYVENIHTTCARR